eukprot:TRINITY_DN59999_c0_g1_i1.p1 TRINITY_DN59999_c0_g1~~TRINITY_DN59999_c0_g1_i1.p1  ORF type:complete len:372 (+),score=135.52 TRINITY_DN59999_c0_g1_i1:82-1197(+)
MRAAPGLLLRAAPLRGLPRAAACGVLLRAERCRAPRRWALPLQRQRTFTVLLRKGSVPAAATRAAAPHRAAAQQRRAAGAVSRVITRTGYALLALLRGTRWLLVILWRIGVELFPYLSALVRHLLALVAKIPGAFLRWAEPQPVARQALVLFVGVVLCMFLCAPTMQFNLAAGALLGSRLGGALMLTAVCCGGLVNFCVARWLWRAWAEEQFHGDERFASLEGAMETNGAVVVALLRLCPLFPAGVVSYLCGPTAVTLQDYAGGTLVGYAPASVILAYIGHSLNRLRLPRGQLAPSPGLALVRRVALYSGLGASVVSIAGLGVVGTWALNHVREEKAALERYTTVTLDEEDLDLQNRWDERDRQMGNRLLL